MKLDKRYKCLNNRMKSTYGYKWAIIEEEII